MKLAEIFCDNMVLQQGNRTEIFGEGEGVGCIEFLNHKIDFTANGHFSVILPPLTAGDSFDMTISLGEESVTVKNILVGEVFLAGGQSNMELTLNDTEKIGICDMPNVRCYKVFAPDDECFGENRWQICCGDVSNISAVAYYFAQRLNAETGVPVGIISCNRGGSRIHSWVPEEVTQKEVFKNSLMLHSPIDELYSFNLDNYLYKNCLLPIAPYTVKGVLWYQGESNAVIGEAEHYCGMLSELISHWRGLWKAELPFYVVQLMPYIANPWYADWATVRAQQEKASKTIPNVYMTTLFDTGEAYEIHPTKKKCVGTALANAVLNTLCGRCDLEYSGPVISEWKKSGNTAELTFTHAKGLKLDFDWFAETYIYDENGIHFEVNGRTASAEIKDNKIFVSWIDGINPVGIKMNYWNGATPRLINDSGYFVSPFDVVF